MLRKRIRSAGTDTEAPSSVLARPLTLPRHIEGYVHNFLARNFWKVDGVYEWSDCVSEAYIVFRRVTRLYPYAEPRHQMSLFKTAWANEFVNLAAKTTKVRATVTDEEDGPSLLDAAAVDVNRGEFNLSLERAPEEVRLVIEVLLDAPSELFDAVSSLVRGGRTAAANKRLCAAVGLARETDLVGAVRKYFGA